MKRIIINNNADLSDELAIEVVRRVINEGKISNEGKQYCYVTSFNHPKVRVVASVNKELTTHSFKIVN